MDTYHVIGKHGVYCVEADNPLEAHLKLGYRLTGIRDSLRRFEIMRQPEGVYGAKATWTLWDHRYKDRVGGTPWVTRKAAAKGLEEFTNKVIQRQTEYEFRINQGQTLTNYPDGSTFWSDGTQWICGGN